MMVGVVHPVLLLLLLSFLGSLEAAKSRFNQTAGYRANVEFKSWSNFYLNNGGCVTCPYTCATPKLGPDGKNINVTNATEAASLPAIYKAPRMNGCCFAKKGKSKKSPSCASQANPPDAEDCGFLSGPAVSWDITSSNPPEDPMSAILFASIDCISFWAVGKADVKQDRSSTSKTKIKGSKVINGGCYGSPKGTAIVLATCLTTYLKFDKSRTYTWEMLAEKCIGLGGKCTRTNSLWGRNLKCCKSPVSLESSWDTNYEKYTKLGDSGVRLSGLAITGIVFGGVALLMCLVHYGAKVRESAKKTALMREQEATDDYEEIITPLTSDQQPAPLNRTMGPTVDVSLIDGDVVRKKGEAEVLFEGDLY